MQVNPLKKLENLGQAIWLDFISREIITNGKLKQLIAADGLKGVTSNPSIFEKAIAESSDYDQDIQSMRQSGKDISAIYAALTQHDIQNAADQFRDLYQQTHGKDGYVSLEVNPHLAHDTQGTVAEARQLWKAVNRPNVMIKVPGTKAGLPAITQLISEGININVTLLFGVPRYEEVAQAYLVGLEQRLAKGESLQQIRSVASFFLSRIDVLLDPLLNKMSAAGDEKASIAKKLQGQVAIASAKIAYQYYKKLTQSERFQKLAEKGAHPQRLLWASTSTKNPAYSDVMYVEALIGADTINTLPMETLDAYRDHGDPKPQLEQNIDQANWAFQQLPTLGVSLEKITQQLENEGVDKFVKSFDQLLAALKKK